MPESSREQRFDDLYRTTFAAVYAYCVRRVGRRDDVDDVVSEVYAAVWRRLDDALAADAPLAWIYGVAYRTIGNRRRGAARSLRLVDRLRAQPRERATAPDDHVAAAERRRELRAHLDAALAELSPVDAEIVRLSVWEELSHGEIADIVGVDAPLVRSRLYRSKQRLERALQNRDIGWSPDTKGSTTREGDTSGPSGTDQGGPA
ncbi:MAG: sigma-70 family RNA polymerase sigma factor [Actinomycetota bacterium]